MRNPFLLISSVQMAIMVVTFVILFQIVRCV